MYHIDEGVICIEQDWGLSDEWPPVVSNGFTGG